MIQTIKATDIKKLRNLAAEKVITIYMPLQRGPLGHKQNNSQFHAIRAQLKKDMSLVQYKLLSKTTQTTIDALGYANDHKGLMVVITDTNINLYALPFTPTLDISISNCCNVDQASKYIKNNKVFYVLAISKKGSHLFKGDKTELHHIPVKGLGTDLPTTLRIDELETNVLQNHPISAGAREGFHGHGGIKDIKKSLYESYLRAVDKNVLHAIKDKTLPLVLVAVDYGQTTYKHISKYPSIVIAGVTTNPDRLSTDQLHQMTAPLVL